MRKNSLYIFPIIAVGLLFAKKALAVCPICTVAAATGIGFSRWLGIDDTITGLWIGGLTVSLITWTIDWLGKKNIRFKGLSTLPVRQAGGRQGRQGFVGKLGDLVKKIIDCCVE